MKKEYKAPVLGIVKVETETLMVNASQQQDNEWANGKKNGQGFADDEADIAPAAPKKFWDDED